MDRPYAKILLHQLMILPRFAFEPFVSGVVDNVKNN